MIEMRKKTKVVMKVEENMTQATRMLANSQ
jgi:hypothetical protein